MLSSPLLTVRSDGCLYDLDLQSDGISLTGFWPTINALARRVVDCFFVQGVLPVFF